MFHSGLPSVIPGPTKFSSESEKRKLNTRSKSLERSRSPLRKQEADRSESPPHKRHHHASGSGSGTDSDTRSMIVDTQLEATKQKYYSFLLTNFDPKYQSEKMLLQQITKYLPRDTVHQIIPTRNGIIIKSTDVNFATTIRNKHSFEIFGKNANMTKLTQKRENKHIRLDVHQHYLWSYVA